MTKTIGNTKVKHISLLILKISFLTLFGCEVKIHKINPIFGYRVKITPDINLIYKVKQLYVDLMLLVISLLTLLMRVGCNQGVKVGTLGRQNESNLAYFWLALTSIFGLCFMPVCLIKSNSFIYSSLIGTIKLNQDQAFKIRDMVWWLLWQLKNIE